MSLRVEGRPTEKAIQIQLYHRLNSGSRIMVPNSMLYGWEADMLRVTKSGYVYEFEIKVTASDFYADKRKAKWYSRNPGANYFTYVMPKDLVKLETIPEDAGIWWYTGRRGWCSFEIARRPKKKHPNKVTEKQMARLTNSLTFKFWNIYINYHGNTQHSIPGD